MIGAIAGDIAGSEHEFDPISRKTGIDDFPLFSSKSCFTDDTVMTLAIGRGILECKKDLASVRESCARYVKQFGRRYPNRGYGLRFQSWLDSDSSSPYGSFGNGSAMRVAPAAWAFDTIWEVEVCAAATAAVTHNHPEGIRGACATAAAIFLARTGRDKREIRTYLEGRYEYDLSRSVEELRATYAFDATCPGSVPEALVCFLESRDLESCLRNAIIIRGDSDTQAAIAGSIAEAMYGVPEEIRKQAESRLDPFLLSELRKQESSFAAAATLD